MKNQSKTATNFELKKCKCERECERCKAMKMRQLDQLTQN